VRIPESTDWFGGVFPYIALNLETTQLLSITSHKP